MKEFDAKLIDVIQRTHDIKSFRFKVADDVVFQSGQYFFVTLNVDDKLTTKAFSFSNSPTEKGYIEFTKRITQSPFSKVLNKIDNGVQVHIRLPFGGFVLAPEQKKVAFLSGGIGITPIRSICKYATDTKLDTDIVLLYGNSTEEEIAFREDFDRMQVENTNLRIIYTLTSTEIKEECWSGRCGLIDKDMLCEEIPDWQERVFFICGPPGMVKGLICVLKDALNIPDERIKLEKFAGY